MTRRAIIAILLGATLFVSPCMGVTLRSEPDARFAWNQFKVIGAVDSVAVLAGNEGILTASYDRVSQKFVAMNQLVTMKTPWKIVSNDSIVVAVFQDRQAYLLDRAALPAISVRGVVQLPVETVDLLLTQSHAYIAAGFRGLMWTSLGDYSGIGALDSAQDGVHVVSVSRHDDRLMVCDDYNGVLEYQIQNGGSVQLVDFLLLPFQAASVATVGDTAFLVRGEQDSLVRIVKDSIGWTLDAARVLPFGCMSVFVMDTFLVTVAADLGGFSVLCRGSLALVGTVTNLTGPTIRFPAQFGDPGATRLVVPGQSGGLMQYFLDWFDVGYSGREAYFPSGAINSITFHNDWLVAGGLGGWCHGYDCRSGPAPDTEIVVYDGIGIVAKVKKTVSGTAILNSALRKINLTRDQGMGPKPFATFFLGHAATDFSWGTLPISGSLPVFIWAGQDGYLYSFGTDNTLTYEAHVAVPVAMRTAVVRDSLLIVSVAKFGLQVYKINSNYSLSLMSSFSDVAETGMLFPIPTQPGRLAALWADQFSIIDMSDPLHPTVDTTVTLPSQPVAGEIRDSLLFLIGGNETTIWNILGNSAAPVMVGSTPFGGYAVATNGSTMAITNGSGIYTFDLRDPAGIDEEPELLPASAELPVNYPNPFNPNTTIQFEIAQPGSVRLEIFNIAGQIVRSFGERPYPAGTHRIEWDGRDDRGQLLASGTYFCRIVAQGVARTGKMMLLK